MIEVVEHSVLVPTLNLAPPKDPARTIKPRKHGFRRMPILAWDYRTNEAIYSRSEVKGVQSDIVSIIKWLRDGNWPHDDSGRRLPIVCVCDEPNHLLYELQPHFEDDPEWNFALFVREGESHFWRDGKARKLKAKLESDREVKFFGFRDSNRKTRYFHPISPHTFIKSFDSYCVGMSTVSKMFHFAGELQRWMKQNDIRFSAAKGGLAAQLLRDSRFYPEARRKVPMRTNENVRPTLPGNYYYLNERNRDKRYTSVYIIDQENAHHWAAETVTLPDANTLFARGRFLTLSDCAFARAGSERFKQIMSEHGLLRVRAIIPRYHGGALPPWAQVHGVRDIYLYTNEIEFAESFGVDIRYISHAWTSPDIDTGMSAYARWAQDSVSTVSLNEKKWLKPVLLSAYGVLGARPRHLTFAYLHADKGTLKPYFFREHRMMLYENCTEYEIQSPVANVIHRGMIEAETRKLTIELGRQLERDGHTIVGLHSDSVVIHDQKQQIPLLSPPWRVKERLTGFVPLDAQSFESDTIRCLPGRREKYAS